MPINDSSAQTFDSHIQKIGINLKSYFNSATVPVWISCLLIFVVALFSNCGTLNLIFAQIEISTDEKITSPLFNQSQNQGGTQPSLEVLYSALDRNTIVGEVKNNLSYPIEQVRVTATLYDKNGVIVATGDKYVNDYLIQPGSRSGFDIFLDETLPSESKYILITSFEKSEDVNPEALQLSVGKNSKTSNSFKVLGEVMNQGKSDANAVKVSAIFYDEGHKVIDTNYVYTNPDIIGPNKKAPFEFSFYVGNPDKIKSMAFNVQSDEYSLMTNNGQNNTISQQ
jgi:hypothetical protein